MPLFGRKTKHAEDALQARVDKANTAQQDTAGYSDNSGNTPSSIGHTTNGAGTSGDFECMSHSNQGTRSHSGEHSQNSEKCGFSEGPAGASNGPSQSQGSQGGVQFGSTALKEHGIRLEREAEKFHNQSNEIAEAERLEEEAREHRERAVASGVDPIYRKPLGALKN